MGYNWNNANANGWDGLDWIGWYVGEVKYRAPYGAYNDANDASAVGESLTEEVMYRENYLQSWNPCFLGVCSPVWVVQVSLILYMLPQNHYIFIIFFIIQTSLSYAEWCRSFTPTMCSNSSEGYFMMMMMMRVMLFHDVIVVYQSIVSNLTTFFTIITIQYQCVNGDHKNCEWSYTFGTGS